MASFVSGGGGGSKYEDIIQSSVANKGIGYIEEFDDVVLPETTITIPSGETSYYMQFPNMKPLFGGETYIVTYNGVEYESEAFGFSDGVLAVSFNNNEILAYDLINEIGFWNISNIVNNITISVEYKPTIILQEQTFNISEFDNYNVYTFSNMQEIYAGYNYRITYNGVEYILPNLSYEYGDYISIDSITGVESSIYWDDGNGSIYIRELDSLGYSSITIKIESAVYSNNIVNKIDSKFLGYVIAGQDPASTLGARATTEGYNTTASGTYAHAEGNYTKSSGISSHAEGMVTTASNTAAHAEGYGTTASGTKSHAEGDGTTASGGQSHAEGYKTTASGGQSHAEGDNTTASGYKSHAEGLYTTAQRRSQHVFGEYNVLDTTGTASTRGAYVEIVGKGTSNNARSNARTLDWSGNETLAGKLTVGTAPTANMDVATKKYVDDTASTKVPKSYSTYGGSVGVNLTSSHKTKSNTETGYFKIYTFDENNSTNTFEIDSTSTTIHKVVTPTEDGDAVNKKYVDDSVASIDALPSQSGNSGRYLTTNGTEASWARVKELFECTYGTTTYSEITTVINYKLPYLNRNRKCYIYSGSIGDGNYETLCFDNVSNGILSRITCSDMNVWTELTAITVVPNTRTINSKALSSDITLTASDVGALPSSTTIPAQISKIYTGTCNTAASTATKTVTLDDSTGFSLAAGVKVAVTFTNGNSTATPALNVNSTGVYTIAISSGVSSYKTGDGTTYNGWGAYETLIFTYTGTYWVHEPSGRLSNLSYNLADRALPKSSNGGGGAYGASLTIDSGAAGNVSDGYFRIYAWSDGNDSNTFQVDSTSTAIHKVVTPTVDGDAANKKYVDDGLGTKQKQITVSTSEPTSTDGVDGDIWFVYEE